MLFHSSFLLLVSSVSTIITGICGFKTWECENKQCIRNDTENIESAVSLGECKLTCLQFAAVWPAPQTITTSQELIPINPHSVSLIWIGQGEVPELLTQAFNLFKSRLEEQAVAANWRNDGRNIEISVTLHDPNVTAYTTSLNESYQVNIVDSETDGLVSVHIDADNFFGARHGLETTEQLIIQDDLRQQFKIMSAAEITDAPVYTHRGISLDTARSFISIDTIMRTIDGMALNKMNSLHWHITDTHSFPFELKKHPQMTEIGAYSSKQIYSQEEISNLIKFAKVRGVRIIPEFDAPAHVGEGWQIFPDLITCFRWTPFSKYCSEPPCGQFDPTNDNLYPILGDIFQEYRNLFDSDVFHMGGDEVNVNCWNSTERIVKWMTDRNMSLNVDSFHDIWNRFQQKALEQWRKTGHDGKIILWTSSLTTPERINKYLNPDEYIIQLWSPVGDHSIGDIVQSNYSVIFSNYDELYLDCGGPAWLGGPGQNWCSPYKGWQSIYNHDPVKILRNLGLNIDDRVKSLILGSEAALWTEQVDDHTVDYRLWPRAAALAERLWSDSKEDWTEAQYRMNYHRDRLVQRKIGAELLQPQWCAENDGQCGAL